MNSQEQYKLKYLKYKNKYIHLKNKLQKNIKGGECIDASGNPVPPLPDYEDPVNMSNLSDIEPNKRITINKKCYNIDDIHRWVITESKNTDPYRNPISQTDRQRIIDLHAQVYPTVVNNSEPAGNSELVRNSEPTELDSRYSEMLRQYHRNVREATTNPDRVLEAVRRNGMALQYASTELKANREIVLEAVRQNGLALEFASEALQRDPDIIAVARQR